MPMMWAKIVLILHHYHGHDQDHRCLPYFKICTMYMLWFSSSLSAIFKTFAKSCGAQLILIVFQLSLPVLYAVVQSPVKLWVSSSWGSSIPRSTSKGIWSSWSVSWSYWWLSWGWSYLWSKSQRPRRMVVGDDNVIFSQSREIRRAQLS